MWLQPIPGRRRGLVAASNGKWVTPQVATEPYHYYRATFQATADAYGYFAAKHFRTPEEQLIADHYEMLGQSEDWQEVSLYFRCPPETMASIISWEPAKDAALRISDISIEPVKAPEVAALLRRSWQQLEQMNFTPPQDRWDAMPRLREKLEKGETVRMVMLGDSIVNDISNSLYETVIEERYPGSRLEIATSVRGSTGCTYYQKPEHLHEHVLRHSPDLLIVGGISNRNDIDAIRAVVRQTQAGCPAEILLMSEAFGAVDHRYAPAWRRFETPPNSFRDNLRRLARETGSAFLDMAGCIGCYCADNEIEDWRILKRDRVHANRLGRVVAARYLDLFFAP